jgi:NAD(P)-dependent dehydrogenase (short-subunit alcohol dehydrogenase family)/acyl carrier protein
VASGLAPASVAVVGETAPDQPGVERYDDLDALLRAVEGGASAPQLIVAPLAEGGAGEGVIDRAHADLRCALGLLQGVLAEPRLASARLCIATRGGVAGGASIDVGHAAVWGMARSAQAEHPGRVGLIDLDGNPESSRLLPAALAALDAEPQLALRGGRLLAPRLLRSPSADGATAGPIDPEKTVLITGGTGGLGSLLARHLAREHGVRHLLLASRGGRDAEGTEALLAELARRGAAGTVVACDLAERAQVETLLATVPSERPLGAVIHAAGTVQDGLLESLDRARLDAVLAPKLDAAWHLHELTAGLDLSHFVVFSSAAGVLGTPGQANYAAANAALDALAAQRQEAGLPATSLAWGVWALETGISGGMRDADLARLARIGLAPLSPEQGLRLFDAALRRAEPALAPVAFDRAALRARAAAGALPPVLARLAGATPVAGVRQSLAERLGAVPEAARPRLVLELVREHVAAVLGHASAAAIEPDAAFTDLGFDSLAAVELRNRLGAATGMRIQPTLVFDHPSAAAVAEHLLDQVGAGSAGDEGAEATGRPPSADQRDDASPERLAALSHEEMFALIDEEFGAR